MMRPNFVEFLNKLYEMSGGKLRTIDRYEVGREVGVDKEQTDHLVEQLFQMDMVRKMIESEITLSPQAKQVLDAKKNLSQSI